MKEINEDKPLQKFDVRGFIGLKKITSLDSWTLKSLSETSYLFVVKTFHGF
jgi:hypothetical protein